MILLALEWMILLGIEVLIIDNHLLEAILGNKVARAIIYLLGEILFIKGEKLRFKCGKKLEKKKNKMELTVTIIS